MSNIVMQKLRNKSKYGTGRLGMRVIVMTKV